MTYSSHSTQAYKSGLTTQESPPKCGLFWAPRPGHSTLAIARRDDTPVHGARVSATGLGLGLWRAAVSGGPLPPGTSRCPRYHGAQGLPEEGSTSWCP